MDTNSRRAAHANRVEGRVTRARGFLCCGLAVAAVLCAARPSAAERRPSYYVPELAKAPFDASRLTVPEATRKKTAATIGRYIRTGDVTRVRNRMEIYPRLLGIALLLDPRCKDAVIANGQLKRGAMPTPAKGQIGIMDDMLATELVAAGDACKKAGKADDLVLAGHLYALAAVLDPNNGDAVYAVEMYTAEDGVIDWSFAGGPKPKGKPSVARKPAEAATGTAIGPKPPAAFATRNKDFVLRQSATKILLISMLRDGRMLGKACDAIVTVNPHARKGSAGRTSFARAVGKEMDISLDEALRAAQVRYPFWEPHDVVVSFGDKYTPKDGGSAGTAFSVLLLSLLDGFEIDKGLGITGDITVDWKVRKVGGTPAKIRGAVLDKCRVIAIPKENEADIGDMLLLYPSETLWTAQIFSIATLQEAIALARLDKPKELRSAMTMFTRIQHGLLRKTPGYSLRSKAAQENLRRVVRLAPNHLSARYMLLATAGKLPRVLSLGASLHELGTAAGPLLPYMDRNQRRYKLKEIPDDVCKTAENRLRSLARKVDPQTRSLQRALYEYVSTLNVLQRIERSRMEHQRKQQMKQAYEERIEACSHQVKNAIQELGANRKFLETIAR